MPEFERGAATPNPLKYSCPSREILALIGGKWCLMVLCYLEGGPARTGELMRALEGVSQKMLTQTLRDMEAYGLLARTSYPEVPPRVEYSLTTLGASLATIVRELEGWVVANYDEIRDHYRTFSSERI